MPHHSAQKRQMPSYGSPGGPHSPGAGIVAGGGVGGGSAGFSPRPFVPTTQGNMDLRVMPPQGGVGYQHHRHPSPMMRGPGSHNIPMTNSWSSANTLSPNQNLGGMTPANGGMIHRLGSGTTDMNSPRRVQSSPNRGMLVPSHDGSKSFDSSHEVAASVLLLAASAMKEKDSALLTRNQSGGTSSASSSTDEAEPSVPLKKRLKANSPSDIMRRTQNKSTACHISPHSEHSKQLTPSGPGTASPTNTATPSSRQASAESAASYDLKDGEALPDSAKINDAKEITPPTHVEIPHFPSVLHAVLTESEFAGSVLQWLPHGQAWKIVRWDALRRQVLPKYFSQLREEDGKGASGSIDAFLWHLSAWGFEEVTDGVDAGAYSHVLFRRELPRLCHEMRFSPSAKDIAEIPSLGARAILQVPSLASTAAASDHTGRRGMEEEKKEDSPNTGRQGSSPWANSQMVGGPISMIYHPEIMASSSAASSYTDSPNWAGHRYLPSYSPIRVRSGRGAGRLPMSRGRVTGQPESQSGAPPRSSFPVSNRGRGRSVVRRPSVPGMTMESKPVVTTPPDSSSHVSPSTPPKRITPRPILKRKLPMMTRKSSSSSTEEEEGNHEEIEKTQEEVAEEEEEEEGDEAVDEKVSSAHAIMSLAGLANQRPSTTIDTSAKGVTAEESS